MNSLYMYVTAFLMFLLLVSLIVSERKDYKGLYSFDKATTLPLRGLLALLIISHHLGQCTSHLSLSQFTSNIGKQPVAVFFFISGYGLCVSYLSKREDYLNCFLKKRMGKLLPEFLLLTIGIVTIFELFGIVSLQQQINLFAERGWTPLPFSWFIYAIFYVYVSFYICAKIVKSPRNIGLLFTVSSLIYVFIVSGILQFDSYWYVTIICVNAGYFVALYEKKISSILSSHRFLCYSALTAVLFVSFCANAKITIGFVRFGFTEIWLLAQAFAVYVIVRALGFLQWKWLCNIGVFSLELYLIHGIPLIVGQHFGLDNWPLWIFTYAVSIPSAFLLNWSYDTIRRRITPLRA